MKSASCMLSALTVVFCVCTPALAQNAAYLDDRSDAVAIVKSFYNAVNRREYGRAWSYFGDAKPSPDFDTFAKGFATTDKVEILTGNVASEGAAGSTFYYVPVAIVSTAKDGAEKVFAGCYTARLANPEIQGQTFQPLHLEKGSLKPASQPAAEAVPAQCPDAPAPQQADAVLEVVKTAFATHADQCSGRPSDTDGGGVQPETYPIAYRFKSDAETDPERQARLFRFYCSAGAYNETHIYYLHDEIGGLREIHFAAPELDIRYENDNTEGNVESINIIGYRADGSLVNSFYDEATKSISSFAKWRGVGDASASGTWMFRDGEFTLVRYDVDASYDGEINPETLIDYNTGP